MRNKEKFLEDYNKVVKPEFQNNGNTVEDAAHTLNHSINPILTVLEEFTTTNQPEHFVFEQKERPKTDEPNEQMLDWVYVGKDEE
ncbi:hypothetical protein [Enterococcus faecium]|uniref:hypothetical protein n=1 Tax=Enterococcus faecium TaxID=1352 RepID=UPI000F5093CD|nr:hypothetical protein [Enterococcus faecium]ROY16656.1 hypothetical protein EGW55_03855 [Enterococcus faecium]HAR1751228.1 hypothetical protein [Enterococcus faecium]